MLCEFHLLVIAWRKKSPTVCVGRRRYRSHCSDRVSMDPNLVLEYRVRNGI
jgi:hypothetical protein